MVVVIIHSPSPPPKMNFVFITTNTLAKSIGLTIPSFLSQVVYVTGPQLPKSYAIKLLHPEVYVGAHTVGGQL